MQHPLDEHGERRRACEQNEPENRAALREK
jgi:hypothetical protein